MTTPLERAYELGEGCGGLNAAEVKRLVELSRENADGPSRMAVLPKLGARVRLLHDIERYPHFIAPKGAEGLVVWHEPGETFCVRLDKRLEGAEAWDNEIVWSLRDGDDPRQELELA